MQHMSHVLPIFGLVVSWPSPPDVKLLKFRDIEINAKTNSYWNSPFTEGHDKKMTLSADCVLTNWIFQPNVQMSNYHLSYQFFEIKVWRFQWRLPVRFSFFVMTHKFIFSSNFSSKLCNLSWENSITLIFIFSNFKLKLISQISSNPAKYKLRRITNAKRNGSTMKVIIRHA